MQGSTPTDESKKTTRRSELALLPAMIGTQTLTAFSDRADEYEPTDLALIDLVPADLALLNISPAQPVAPIAKEATTYQAKAALIEIANTITAAEEFDCDDDDEYLAALVSIEVEEFFEEVEKTLPDPSAF